MAVEAMVAAEVVAVAMVRTDLIVAAMPHVITVVVVVAGVIMAAVATATIETETATASGNAIANVAAAGNATIIKHPGDFKFGSLFIADRLSTVIISHQAAFGGMSLFYRKLRSSYFSE